MPEQKKPIYKSYVLVAKKGNEKLVIDWTKVKPYSEFKKQKYSLKQIDFFTSHFVSKEELCNFLIKAELATPEQLSGASFWIYPAKQNKVEQIVNGKTKKVDAPILADEQLQYGIAYADVKRLLEDDYYVISLLQSKITDYDFICNLYNKYVKNGKYSERIIENLKAQERIAEDNYRRYRDSKYEGMRKSYIAQRIGIQESHSLLRSVMNYAEMLKRGEYPSNEAYQSVRNNIKEFYLREKYTVIGCRDGLYDNRILEYKKNKDGSILTNYVKFHKLILFIAKELSEEEKKTKEIKEARAKELFEQGEDPKVIGKMKIIKRERKGQIPGQLTLFDYFGNIEEPQKKR